MKDLGWANGWSYPPFDIIQCRDSRHLPKDEDTGHAHRGIEHVVSCELCGYVYRYDSGD